MKSDGDKDINKVLLFSKKDKLTPAFMAAISELRDRLRFYVITVAEKNPNADSVELQKLYKAENLPKLMVEETYDATNGSVLAEARETVYEKTEFKYLALVDFFEQFARKEKKEEVEDMQESKADEDREK